MNCADFLDRLDLCVETRATPAVLLQQHASVCLNDECREAWADFVLLNEAIHDWNVHRQALVPVPSSGTSRARIRRMLGSLAAAAACAGAVFVMPFLSSPASLQTAANPTPVEAVSSEAVMVVLKQQDSVGKSVEGFSIDWIAVAPERVSNSMASLLLGNREPAPEGPADGKWLDGWRQQILPIEENFEVIRGLLMEREGNQSFLSPIPHREPLI